VILSPTPAARRIDMNDPNQDSSVSTPLAEERPAAEAAIAAGPPGPTLPKPSLPPRVRVGPGVHPLFANTFSIWGDASHIRVMACESTEHGPTPIHTFLVVPTDEAEALCFGVLELIDKLRKAAPDGATTG
jgi:hypothetical protein